MTGLAGHRQPSPAGVCRVVFGGQRRLAMVLVLGASCMHGTDSLFAPCNFNFPMAQPACAPGGRALLAEEKRVSLPVLPALGALR